MSAVTDGSAVPVIACRGLTRTLGEAVKQTILRDVTLDIARGDFVALTGASGSGKSTLLYLLGALDRPSAGTLVLDGVDLSSLDDDARAQLRNEKLGFVFQFHFLLPEFSVVENVMIPMLRRGLDDDDARARAMRTLGELGLGDYAARRPSELSGGQQQRVSIARALANEPVVLLADEPTGNLDSRNAETVFTLFESLNRTRGMTVVMVTHDADFASRAPRQVVLKDGAVLSDTRRAIG